MTTLDRYLLRKITNVFILVCIVLGSIVWLTQSLRLLEVLTESNIPIGLFLSLVALSAPNFIYVILPIACAIAILITLHRLTYDHEMVAMIACGIAPARLARPVLSFAALVAGLTFYLGTYGTPFLNQKFFALTSLVKAEYATLLFRGGSFRRISPQVTIFIQERINTEDLRGILLHDARNADAPLTLVAESGSVRQTEDGLQLIMNNGNRQRGIGADLDILRFGRYIATLNPENDPDIWPRLTSEMSLPELWGQSGSAIEQRDARGRLHHVLSLPLFTLLCAWVVFIIRIRSLSPRFDQQIMLNVSLALALLQMVYLATIMAVRAGHAPPIIIYLVMLASLTLAAPWFDRLARRVLLSFRRTHSTAHHKKKSAHE